MTQYLVSMTLIKSVNMPPDFNVNLTRNDDFEIMHLIPDEVGTMIDNIKLGLTHSCDVRAAIEKQQNLLLKPQSLRDELQLGRLFWCNEGELTCAIKCCNEHLFFNAKIALLPRVLNEEMINRISILHDEKCTPPIIKRSDKDLDELAAQLKLGGF